MAITTLTTLAVGSVTARPSDLNLARAATGRFHDISVAEGAGYGLPPAPAPLHECIDNPAGTMGFHWVNGGLLDTTVDPANPDPSCTTPTRTAADLGAPEYVVFQGARRTHERPIRASDEAPSLRDGVHERRCAAEQQRPDRVRHPAVLLLHVWL
jgi:hypothetical protein